jgi:hypothetical protein
VDPHLFRAFLLGPLDQGGEMIDVGMDVAVGKEAEEVQGSALLGIADDVLPSIAREQLAGGYGLVDQGRALLEDLARSNGIVAHFGVAHVVVARQAYGLAMRFQEGVGIVREESVQHGLVGLGDGVAFDVLGDTVTVHDHDHDGAGDAGKGGQALQHIGFLGEE